MHPISGFWLSLAITKKHPLFRGFSKNLPETILPRNTPFPEKMSGGLILSSNLGGGVVVFFGKALYHQCIVLRRGIKISSRRFPDYFITNTLVSQLAGELYTNPILFGSPLSPFNYRGRQSIGITSDKMHKSYCPGCLFLNTISLRLFTVHRAK